MVEEEGGIAAESRNEMKLFNLIRNEAGQDLVEYVLVVALIACGAIAGMSSVASSINIVFGAVSSDIASSL